MASRQLIFFHSAGAITQPTTNRAWYARNQKYTPVGFLLKNTDCDRSLDPDCCDNEKDIAQGDRVFTVFEEDVALTVKSTWFIDNLWVGHDTTSCQGC